MAPQLRVTKGTVLSRAVVVDRLGDQFLACSALSGDQDIGLGGADLLEEIIEGQHLRTLADDIIEMVAVPDHLLQKGYSPFEGSFFRGHS